MKHVYRTAVLSIVAASAFFSATSSAQAGLVLANSNVNQAFLASANTPTPDPNSPFKYGYIITPGNPNSFQGFSSTQYTDAFVDSEGVKGYNVPTDQFVPAIVINTNPGPKTLTYGPTLAEGQILLHPGGTTGSNAYLPPIAYADLRYVAPVAGLYSLTGIFSKLHNGDTEVFVFLNGLNLFDAPLTSGSPTASFNLLRNLAVGDKVDFLVGPGPDNFIGSDSTGLFANVALATPEPSTLVSAVLGGFALLGSAQYRKRATRQKKL